jgi:hypothetical protein
LTFDLELEHDPVKVDQGCLLFNTLNGLSQPVAEPEVRPNQTPAANTPAPGVRTPAPPTLMTSPAPAAEPIIPTTVERPQRVRNKPQYLKDYITE